MSKLRIGISACYFHSDPQRPIFKGKTLLYLEQSLAHWALREGVLAYLIPSEPGAGTSLEEIAADLDGLILQGGSDVSPQSYGEASLKPEWKGDYIRDQYESALLKHFMAQEKPVLGVCRGAQLVNVALGGTLYQDIATQLPQAGDHRNWEIYDQNFHEIDFEPGSRLAQLYAGKKSGKVNSIHHQALKNLGKGLEVEARSRGDGLIEAVRFEGASYVYAVQWHPEFHDAADPSLLDPTPILQDFLKETQTRKGKR